MHPCKALIKAEVEFYHWIDMYVMKKSLMEEQAGTPPKELQKSQGTLGDFELVTVTYPMFPQILWWRVQ